MYLWREQQIFLHMTLKAKRQNVTSWNEQVAAVCFPYKVSIRLSRNGKNLSEFQQSSQLEAHEAAFGKESHVPLNKPIKLENASKSVYVATVLAYCSPTVYGSRENPSEAILHCSYASSSTSC